MTTFKGKRIAVLLGGLSAEREISLKSGTAVATALERRGHDVVSIDAGRDLAMRLTDEGIDVAFVALHGKYGEDGAVQGLLETMGIPYTGSGVMASAVAMDKIISKQLFAGAGLRTPACQVLAAEDGPEAITLGGKIVVKPATTGSTIGIGIVDASDRSAVRAAVDAARKYDARLLIETFVAGKETTVTLIQKSERDTRADVLPMIEIVPPEGFYDFDAKYTYAKGKTEYVIPARISEAASSEANESASKAWDLVGCQGFARADFIVAGDEAHLLELNTIPGMTETSLVPKAAAHVGIDFGDLVERILSTASCKLAQGA